MLKECKEYLQSRNIRINRYQILTLYMVMGEPAYYWRLLQRGTSAARISTISSSLRREGNCMVNTMPCTSLCSRIRTVLGFWSHALNSGVHRAWSGLRERGAQIDLLIDRRDDTINICEMKWASEAYVIDKDYDEKLRNKVAAFIRETGNKNSILFSMVTIYGMKENMYSDAVQPQVVMGDLFA